MAHLGPPQDQLRIEVLCNSYQIVKVLADPIRPFTHTKLWKIFNRRHFHSKSVILKKNIKTPQLQSQFPRKFYKQPMVLMLTLTYQNDVRKILALVLSTLKISPLPPEMTWLTSRKFHSAGGPTGPLKVRFCPCFI